MKQTYWEARVTFLYAPRPQDEVYNSHDESFKGATKREVLNAMEEHTGKMPKRPRKVYCDVSGESIHTGYVWGSWVDANDYDNPNKKVWCEKWVGFVRITEEVMV